MNLKDRARKLKTDIPALFIALKDKNTPIAPKILAGIVMIYALSPIDFIPDFIPIIGYLDDLIILPSLVALTIRLIPKDIMEKCREEASKSFEKNNKKWYYAIPFIFVWIVILIVIAKLILDLFLQ